jgi:ubiquinone/menaquinone biosynthesis C-methylase UbiE
MTQETPPICDYEGSDYQERFWDQADRQYEDRVEAIALQRLLPSGGRRLLEVGAGAGRNTPRYRGFEQVVLLDYARTQLELARDHLGQDGRYLYVVADAYKLPFTAGAFDAATMIRTLHHMSDPLSALNQIGGVLTSSSTFILEYANKRNIKAIGRWLLRRQDWNPFDHQSIEFAELNFNFHPTTIRTWLKEAKFILRRELTVSHFRLGLLKRMIPLGLLVSLDSLLQWTGSLWQYTPSVFVKSVGGLPGVNFQEGSFWRCPACGETEFESAQDRMKCTGCDSSWAIQDGIYNFKEPTSV